MLKRLNPFSKFPPPRYALGFSELLSIISCIIYYRRKGLDPGYEDHFEDLYTQQFSEFMGGGFSDAVSSGCASIYIALKTLALPKGSLIATSPVTDASVIGCITELGHVPYLLDSAANSYNTSVEQLKERYRPDLAALVLTHAGGVPCDVKPILDFCLSHSIELIEDCSQAIGAVPVNQTRPVGTYGRFGCFSTMYRKNLSASGSSGLLYSSNSIDYQVARQHADRGKRWWDKQKVDMRDPGFADFPGLNFNSDEIRCAIGLANLQRLPHTNNRRLSFLKALKYYFDTYELKMFAFSEFHFGLAPFYFPIIVNPLDSGLSILDISVALRDAGLGIGVKYGCLVSTWTWATPYMFDDFVSVNALAFRDSCFHLYVNENYTRSHAKHIAKQLKSYELKSTASFD